VRLVSTALLLLPDFSLILLGVLLRRWASFDDAFWSGLERIVYFVLFPSLLFVSTATAPLDSGATGVLLVIGLVVTASGALLGFAIYPWYRKDPMSFASGVQTAYRFNSYIALAIAGRLGGASSIALMALLIGTNVPLANAAAVFGLARHGGLNLWAALARNPLIIGTLLGLAFNVAGITLPEFVALTLGRLGGASVALGLITVGAGLRLTGVGAPRLLMGWWLVVKLLLLPALAYALAIYARLEPLQREIIVMFAAMPSASSAYILATRMGGNGALVAFLISIGTLISALTMPLWLSLAR
jgi:malonate transporter